MSPVRKNSRQAAILASETTLTTSRSSPLSEHASPDTGPADDKHRLAGAFSIALHRIRPDPSQPRKTIDPAKQRELVDSIKHLGVMQPIKVRFIRADGIYQIVFGECRYLAANELGLTEVPCLVHDLPERDVLLHQIAENWQRADLHPFDIADALAELRDANGYTQRQLAEVTGKAESESKKSARAAVPSGDEFEGI